MYRRDHVENWSPLPENKVILKCPTSHSSFFFWISGMSGEEAWNWCLHLACLWPGAQEAPPHSPGGQDRRGLVVECCEGTFPALGCISLDPKGKGAHFWHCSWCPHRPSENSALWWMWRRTIHPFSTGLCWPFGQDRAVLHIAVCLSSLAPAHQMSYCLVVIETTKNAQQLFRHLLGDSATPSFFAARKSDCYRPIYALRRDQDQTRALFCPDKFILMKIIFYLSIIALADQLGNSLCHTWWLFTVFWYSPIRLQFFNMSSLVKGVFKYLSHEDSDLTLEACLPLVRGLHPGDEGPPG